MYARINKKLLKWTIQYPIEQKFVDFFVDLIICFSTSVSKATILKHDTNALEMSTLYEIL